MNSRERRNVERRWPYCININHDDELLDECMQWLVDNFGTCYHYRKNNPRWCWRPNYTIVGSFVMQTIGAQIYFRKRADYAWFLLKWEQ